MQNRGHVPAFYLFMGGRKRNKPLKPTNFLRCSSQYRHCDYFFPPKRKTTNIKSFKRFTSTEANLINVLEASYRVSCPGENLQMPNLW
jgi:hypothetical protein